jgi:hypothetical protein
MRWAIVTLIVCGVAPSANSGPAAAAGLKLVYKVDSAAATIHGNNMTIIASGAVSTGGWTKARLRLKPAHKSQDGILEFDFVAMPPSADETVIQAFVPQNATLTTRLPAHGETQIKVDAETNSTVVSVTH